MHAAVEVCGTFNLELRDRLYLLASSRRRFGRRFGRWLGRRFRPIRTWGSWRIAADILVKPPIEGQVLRHNNGPS